jgi:AcrR family transcriptional regulator
MSNRDALLAAAERCLREKGYSATTARDLAATAGTSLAAIGYHFGSTEALLNEALDVAFTRWLERLGGLTVDLVGQPLEPALTALLEGLIGAISDDAALLAAFFDATAQAQHSDALRAQLNQHYTAMRTGIADLLNAVAPTQTDAATAYAIASLVIAISDGLAVQYLLDPEALPTPAALAALPAVLQRSVRPRKRS